MHLVFIRILGVVEFVLCAIQEVLMVCAIQEVLMVCYPYAQLTAVYTSLTHYFVLASRAPSITITLNALPITMVATEKPRSPGLPLL